MRIEHVLPIAARVERVWALTIDVESWPRFTSTMTSIERLDDGPLRPGSTVRIKQPAQRERIWTVAEIEPNRRFTWTTRAMGVSMTAGHQLTDSDGVTTNTVSVTLGGSLSRIVGIVLARPMRRSLAAENEGFRAAAESETTAGPGRV